MPLPLISALMATTPARLPMALQALDDFARQTYGRRELVVAVPGLDPMIVAGLEGLAAEHRDAGHPCDMRIVDAAGETCGHARQAALGAAVGDYCVLWDDDDRNHPRRLEAQAGCLGAGAGSAFDGRLVVDLRAGTVTWARADVGPPGGAGGLMPATLAFRRDRSLSYAPGGPGCEDGLFAAAARLGPVAPVRDQPYLACKVIHARNARDPDQLRRWAARRAVEPALLARHVARLAREFEGVGWGGRRLVFHADAGRRPAPHRATGTNTIS